MENFFFSKVLTSFSGYGKTEIEKLTRTVVKNMTTDKQFARFAEDAANLNTIFQNYLNALTTVSDDKGLLNLKIKDARVKLNQELEVVGSFVNGLARGNRIVIVESGYDGTKPPEAITRVGLPFIVKVGRTIDPAVRELELRKTEGVKIYQVRYRYDEDANYQLLCTVTKLKSEIGPFEIGRTVWIQVCGLGARNLITEWTEPESFVAVK